MLLGDAKPIMILWMPIFNPLASLFNSVDKLTQMFGYSVAGVSWMGDSVNWVDKRIRENTKSITKIPIPFYFYERLGNDKENSDFATGFLLDSVTEAIALTFPDAASSAAKIKDPTATTLNIRNTIDVTFRVKMGSTIVSVLRLLFKRALTDYQIANELLVDFIWNEYVITNARIIDYNEDPQTGTDLTMIKIRLETVQEEQGTIASVVSEAFPNPAYITPLPV